VPTQRASVAGKRRMAVSKEPPEGARDWICRICATSAGKLKNKPPRCKLCGQRPFRDVRELEDERDPIDGAEGEG
jgi:rubrerythrin